MSGRRIGWFSCVAAAAILNALVLGTAPTEAQDAEPLRESPFKESLQENQTLQERLLRAINKQLDQENAELKEQVANLGQRLNETLAAAVEARPEFAPWYADDDESIERFELWTSCQPMAL